MAHIASPEQHDRAAAFHGVAIYDAMLSALRAHRSTLSEAGGFFEQATRPDEIDVMRIVSGLMGGALQPMRTCAVTGALLGFVERDVAVAARELNMPFTPELLAEVRAIEFALLAVLP